jgi:hypothetical protein
MTLHSQKRSANVKKFSIGGCSFLVVIAIFTQSVQLLRGHLVSAHKLNLNLNLTNLNPYHANIVGLSIDVFPLFNGSIQAQFLAI